MGSGRPRPDNTRRAFETSLTKLGLDHLDLYLMHQPFGDVYGQWRAMEALNREGAAKAIGVANFYPDRLIDLIINNEITPQVNQIETHPFFQRADYQDLMREHGVQIQSWGGFAEGKNDLFTNPCSPRSARNTTSLSPRSSCAGSPSAASSPSPSPCAPSAWPRY